MKLRLTLALVLACLAGITMAHSQTPPRVVHVFVALADNQNQGIVPVPRKIGNGEDAANNLYWGLGGGVKTFFARSTDWTLLACWQNPKPAILQRCAFQHRQANVYLVADAYRGREIQAAILNFLDAAAGNGVEQVSVQASKQSTTLNARGGSSLLAYIGHNGLMDFDLPSFPRQKNQNHRDVIILACASKQYFGSALRIAGAYPLLWTTNLMAPEAYTLKAALDGWILGENGEQIRNRAAAAYDKYQKCGFNAAHRLLTTGW